MELLEPRSKRELAFDTPGDGEKAMGEEKTDIGVPALLGTSGDVRRLTLPLGSPEFPSEVIRGRFIGTGTRGCTEGKGRLAGMGVRMGMVEILGMDDRPTDRFGMDPIPNRVDEDMFEPLFEVGCCFMVIGNDEGKFLP